MFASDRAAPLENLAKEFVQGSLAASLRTWLSQIDHEIGVDIPVAGMSKTGNSDAMFFLQARREGEEVLESAARHHNIFVEFGQTGISKRVRELAPDLPHFFTLVSTQANLDEQRSLGHKKPAHLANSSIIK